MNVAPLQQLRKELKERSNAELIECCLRLAKFKKDNKELLHYLLFEASDEETYIASVKGMMEEEFKAIRPFPTYQRHKSVRKVLRNLKKFIRYSGKKETEVELLIAFALALKSFRKSFASDTVLASIYFKQIEFIERQVLKLHEDFQFDYQADLDVLREVN